jgi:hypothetical protein
MKTPEGREQWVSAMAAAIQGEEYFRVHDAGDMFSPAYAACWLEVCQRLTKTKFWIPTRAWQQPSGLLPVFDPILNTLQKLAALPNVTVRPSALDFGDPPPVVRGLDAGSTAEFAAAGVWDCPAPTQDGHCGSCRHCWDEPAVPVTYDRH